MYSSFDFYKSEYGGAKIKSEAEYKRLAQKSSSYIDMLTMGRIIKDELSEDLLKKVQLCECELSELLSVSERSIGIESENNDGYSVKFAGGNSKGGEASHCRDIAMRYLWDTGFFYRGIS